MHKRTILTGYTLIFLLLATLGILFVTPPVEATKTWTVDDDGPADFKTIQEAINNATSGDTILVRAGIYLENVVVNKSLTLIGNGSSTTVIDGNGTWTVVRVSAPDVNITGFTVQNGGKYPNSGILIGGLGRNTIRECIIKNNAYGIELHGSDSNIIVGNKIMNNSDEGILVRDSSNNVIHYNMMVNNSVGVRITSGSSLFNKFYHNNFIDNIYNAQDFGSDTKWDNGAEGNYWSDYTGNDLDGDGIGDTAYEKGLITDNYPLMESWSPYRVFSVIIDATIYKVATFSNSTLASFNFSQPLKQISFNVTSGASGFCNITIPKTLLNVSTLEKWKVIIDGRLLSLKNRTITENATHTFIYFTYTTGIHMVQITTRMNSFISIALSSATITLGSNVTISGNITTDDPVNPLRPNVTVTIQSRLIGAVTWHTIETVETDSNSSYSYDWKPETGGIHEVMANWSGDLETLGDETTVLTLTVLYVFEPEGVYIETNSTVSEFNFSQPLKQISFNVATLYGTIGFCNVTIPKELLDSEIGWKIIINGTLLSANEIVVTENVTHTFVYFTCSKGFNTVQITTRMSSTLSMVLSSDSIGLGSSVTISGSVTAEDQTTRPNVNVVIQSRPNGDVNWTTLDTVETDENGIYTYDWAPEETGTYEIKASWPGDEEALGNQSDVLTLTVKWNSVISIALGEDSISSGETVTISGNITAADDTMRPNVPVTILYRLSGTADWTTLDTVETDEEGSYTYDWAPEETGTYEIKATWLGDLETLGDESIVLTLKVKGTQPIPIEIVIAIVAAIAVIAAIAIYFVKIRKP